MPSSYQKTAQKAILTQIFGKHPNPRNQLRHQSRATPPAIFHMKYGILD